MAYQYRGLGSPVQTDTSGYTIINNALANIRDHNPIQALNNLIGNYEYTQARNAVLNSANPYDGLTTYQKLQQLGLSNNYIADRLNDLEAVNNAEVSNIKAARQAASDFNTEALLAEAYRVRASGDPAQIAAFNNKLARNMGMWVASGAVTTDTAKQLYTDENSVKQAVADIGLTKGQTAQAYGAARQANAGALLNELKAQDVAMEQQAIRDYSMLTSAGATDVQSAANLANTWGWPRARFLTAMNAGKIPRYTPLYGDMSTQAGTIKLNDSSNIISTPEQVTVNNTQTPKTQIESSKQDSVIASANSLVDSSLLGKNTTPNILEGSTSKVPGTGVYSAEALRQQAGNKINNSNVESTGEPAVVSQNIPQENYSETPTATDTQITPVNSQPSPLSAKNLQQNTLTTQTQQAAQQEQQIQKDSSKLNAISNQSVIDSGGAAINTSKDGTPYIDIGNNAIYTENGSWKFNEKTPMNQVSAFDVASVQKNLIDINRKAGGNLGNYFNFKVADGKVDLVPTDFVKSFLDKYPGYKPNFEQMRSEVLQAYKPLLTNKNLPAALGHMQAVFGNSTEVKDKGKAFINNLLQASDNNTLSNDSNRTVDMMYNLNGSLEDINSIRNANVIELSNIANSKLSPTDNLKFLGKLIQKNPEVISVELNNALAKAIDSTKGIAADIAAEQIRVDEISTMTAGINLAETSGSSFSHYVTAMQSSDNQKLKNTYDTLKRNGVIFNVSNDSSTDASEVANRIDLNEKTTAEYETSAQKLSEKLQTDLNIPKSVAMYCVGAAGVTANRGVLNNIFPAVSDTNSMMYINVDEAYRQASLYKTFISNPNGRYSVNEMKNRLGAAQASLDKFLNAAGSLEAISTEFGNIPTTLKSGGYNIRNIINKDGTTTSTIALGNVNSRNDILNQGNTITTVKNNISNLDKAIQVTNAAYAKMVQDARPVSESRIVFETASQINRSIDSNYGIYSDKFTYNKNKTPKYNAYLTGSREDYNNSVDNVNNNIAYSDDIFQALKNFTSEPNFNKNASNLISSNNSSNNLVAKRDADLFNALELQNKGATNPAAYTIAAENSERKYGINQDSIETYKLAATTSYKDRYGNTITGSPVAQKRLGDLYLGGVPNLLKKDPAMAVKYYTKAAEQGDTDAQFRLGWCWAHGLGVAQDFKQAVKWFTKAAEHGYADAQYYLNANIYSNNNNINNYINQYKSKNKKKTAKDLVDY